MTTLAEMTLMVARIVSEVVEGEATAANATSLTDTENLIQANEYWDRGTLWFLSGNPDGKVTPVLDHSGNTLTFSAQNPAPAAGQVYAVGRSTYPYRQLTSAINQALHETYLIKSNNALTGNGETLEFSLPAGVTNAFEVHLQDQSVTPYHSHRTTHWVETLDGKLLFDWAYPPPDAWKIVVSYKAQHAKLTNATDTVDTQINPEWLRWKSAEYALYWAVRAYGDAKEYRIEELLNRVIENLKGKWARKPAVRVHTAGG